MECRAAFKVKRANSALQVDTGTHECLIGLLSEAGGDIHPPPLLEFKYSFWCDISPAPSEASPPQSPPFPGSPRRALSAVLSSRCGTIPHNALLVFWGVFLFFFLRPVPAASAALFQVGGTGGIDTQSFRHSPSSSAGRIRIWPSIFASHPCQLGLANVGTR